MRLLNKRFEWLLKHAKNLSHLELTRFLYKITIFYPANTHEYNPTSVARVALEQQAEWCWV